MPKPFTAAALGFSERKATWIILGSSVRPVNGEASTTAASSSARRTITVTSIPSSDAIASSMAASSGLGLRLGDPKTTFPLCRCVRTDSWPSPSTSARRSAIPIRLLRPTLIPRSSAA
jgi:hypothetical protein